MGDTLLTRLRRKIRSSSTRLDSAINAVSRGWDKEAMRLLRDEQRAISEISDDFEAAIAERVEILEARSLNTAGKLSNERSRARNHPTTELVDHAIKHAEYLAELLGRVDNGLYFNEIKGTMGLLKILRDESNGIKPPKCGYNGDNLAGVIHE